jgi:hypothetical protein
MSIARVVWLGAISVALCSRAYAQEAPGLETCTAERFIVLSGDGLDPALFNEVRTDLAAELAHRGIDVCDSNTAREPAALAKLSRTDDTVVIELDDRVTHKRVGRDLVLARLPANGRALAIAIAIDELLRASWAELTLRRPSESEDEDEAEGDVTYYRTRHVVNARGSAAGALRFSLAGELGYAHSSERFDAFSLGARASMRAWQRGWFALGVAGLTSLPVRSKLGDVLVNGLRGTLTAGICQRDRRRTYGCGGARAEVDYLALRGMAPEMARGHVKHAGVLQLGAVGMLAFTVADRRTLFGELAVGGVLLGAEATDGMRTIVGVTGLMIALNLGLEFEL